jgi:hypothetical protein
MSEKQENKKKTKKGKKKRKGDVQTLKETLGMSILGTH